MNSFLRKNFKITTAIVLLLIGGLFVGFNLKNIVHKPLETNRSKGLEMKKMAKVKDEGKVQELKIYDSGTHYTIKDGLPSNKTTYGGN